MERISEGKAPLVLGDGLQAMDFVDVRDIARANIFALGALITDHVDNIASSRETSLLELAQLLSAAMGRADLEPEFGPARKVNPVSRRLADISTAVKDLGWRPTLTIEQGLRDLVKWWQGERGGGAVPSSHPQRPEGEGAGRAQFHQRRDPLLQLRALS